LKNKLQIKFYKMKDRCYNEKSNRYKYYGGKGIDICEQWLENPPSFIEWSINNGWEPGKDIHRKDNDRGYYPDNCIFLSPKEHMHTHRKHLKDDDVKVRSIKFGLTSERRVRILAATDGISFGEWVRRVVDEELRWYQED
jgi:hypothetical protein